MTTTKKRDYYEILGLSRDADEGQIRRAYRALAREHHPDVAAEADDETWQELVEAYATLSNPELKLLYDRFGFRGRGFGEEFAAAAAAAEEDAVSTGRDVVAELDLGYYEAQRGTTRRVRIDGEAVCARCEGEGGETDVCGECDGTGSIRSVSNSEVGRLLQVTSCPVCGGSGKLVVETCDKCGGSGRVAETRYVRVRIPAGVDDGQTVRVRDEGNASPEGGERGDAFIVLRVAEPLPSRPGVRYFALVLLAAAIALLVYLVLYW
jgi:molecular chaperone DnaJ